VYNPATWPLRGFLLHFIIVWTPIEISNLRPSILPDLHFKLIPSVQIMQQSTPPPLFIAVLMPAVTGGFDHIKQEVIFVADDSLLRLNS
jgi:hypothetical protein